MNNFQLPHHKLQAYGVADDLPATGPLRRRLGFRISMARKLFLVSERLAVGWTGNAALAGEILRAFASFPHDEDPTEHAIRRTLSAFHPSPQLDQFECSLIGCALAECERFAFRWDSRKADELYRFRTDHALGTGATTLTKLLERGRRRGDSTDPVTTAVALAGQLLLEEAKTGESLLARFGAGYEVIVEDGDRLRVVDSVTYVVANADGERWALSPWFLKHGHSDEIAYQARIAETIHSDQRICRAVLPSANHPLLPSVTRDTISLRSEYYCIIVDVKVASGTVSLCAAFSGRSPNDVSVKSSPGGEILTIRDETVRNLIQAAVEAGLVTSSDGAIPPDGQFLQSNGPFDFSLSPGFSAFAVMHVLQEPSGQEGTVFDLGRIDGARASLSTAGTHLRFALQDDGGRPGTVEADWTPYFGQPGLIIVTFDASTGEATIYRNDLLTARRKLRLSPTKSGRGPLTLGTDLTKAKPASCTIAEFGLVASCLDDKTRRSLFEYAKQRYALLSSLAHVWSGE